MADLDGSDASPPESQGEFPVPEKLSLTNFQAVAQLFAPANAGGWSAVEFAGAGAATPTQTTRSRFGSREWD